MKEKWRIVSPAFLLSCRRKQKVSQQTKYKGSVTSRREFLKNKSYHMNIATIVINVTNSYSFSSLN